MQVRWLVRLRHYRDQEPSITLVTSKGETSFTPDSHLTLPGPRFASASECAATQCRDLNYREHFHCLDCNSRVFVKKEEMIRHFKVSPRRPASPPYRRLFVPVAQETRRVTTTRLHALLAMRRLLPPIPLLCPQPKANPLSLLETRL